MNEDHDDDHDDDYDREHMENVESMLYANIHYNGGSNVNAVSTQNQSANSDDVQNLSNNYETELNRSNGGSRRNSKRYWTNSTPGTSRKTSNYVPYFKEKQSGVYKKSNVNAALNQPASEVPRNEPDCTVKPATPKAFTPYVSFLPFNDSISNIADGEEVAVAGSSKSDKSPQKQKQHTTNELVRKNVPTKHINPFSKKHMIDEFNNMFNNDDDDSTVSNAKPIANKKRLNPFNALSRKAKKRKSDSNKKQNQSGKTIEPAATNASVIDLDGNDGDDDDDDDVIILPTQAPPLICVDSSDDETTPTKEHAFTEPNAVADDRRKQTRCTSPSSSIQSADDFMEKNDQRNFGFETFGTMSDDDLRAVGETVDNDLRKTTQSNNDNGKCTVATENDNAIFTPPKQMQKDKSKGGAKKSYEVGANSFSAVDVYESESSDMPDTIYSKGMLTKRKLVADSDSSIESIPISKSKRLRKRKSSGSAKESDKHSADSSSDLLDDDDDDDDSSDDNAGNLNDGDQQSYLVRGEALGKIKNINKKKKDSNKMNRNAIERRSQDDFINKLSSIVYDQSKSDDNENENENDNEDDAENQNETSAESVAARDIVESVLQRRTKKSKQKKLTADDANESENNNSNAWNITDQIGETDDFELDLVQGLLNTTAERNEEEPTGENAEGNREANITPSDSNALAVLNQPKEPSTSNQLNESVNLVADQNENQQNEIEIDLSGKEISWNEEMRRFYNDSWGGETFSLRSIRARMQKDFLNWMISGRDKSQILDIRRQIRCQNCQEKGHKARNCPRPPATKRCYMCGFDGHLEGKCPNKICLICGRKSQKYSHGCGECNRDREVMCYICKQRGHRQIFCPDRWRRYHSTTTLDQPLVPASMKGTPKPKYCCICAHKGHVAEQCKRADRVSAPLSVHVSSYRPLLHPTDRSENTAPKCTVLSSNLGEFKFNFGNDVSETGSSIYARFRRAVNLNSDANRDNALSDNDVVLIQDTSDRPFEVYDDLDFSLERDIEEITSSEQFSSEGAFNASFASHSSNENETLSRHQTRNEYIKHDIDDINISTENADAEIQALDNKLKTLNELKVKMLSHKFNANDGNSTTVDETTDTSRRTEQKDDVSTSSVLPDFIPLSSNEPEKFEATRSPSPVSADSTTANVTPENSDATIHLTAKHCKKLLSTKGGQFLNSFDRLGVKPRLEWRQYGHVLIVNGTAEGQQNFHRELKEFLDSNDGVKATYNSLVNSLPKNRDALLRFIRSQVILLDSKLCNQDHLADVHGLYARICDLMKKQPSKATVKHISKLRKHLNMVLFGRYGLADGRMHLSELQDCVRHLDMSPVTNITKQVRFAIGEHMDYIFSDKNHENYEAVINHYNALKRDRMLPPLKLNQKLFGLKINVLSSGTDANSGHASNAWNNERNAYGSSSSSSTSAFNRTPQNFSMRMEYDGRTNALPSSGDIQINVSTSSNSYYNQPRFANRETMPRNHGSNFHQRLTNYTK